MENHKSKLTDSKRFIYARLIYLACATLLATAPCWAQDGSGGNKGIQDPALRSFESQPSIKRVKAMEKSARMFWPPADVDAAVPPVVPEVSCPADDVLRGARDRVEELVSNLDRFTATETIDSTEIGKSGKMTQSLTYSFNYVATTSVNRAGRVSFDESRVETGKTNRVPIPVRTIGLAIGAAVFHPQHDEEFESTCEGLGEWQGRPAWQVRFQQRPGVSSEFQSVYANGTWSQVALKGRAWVSAENQQIQHIEFDLLKPVRSVRLRAEHLSVEYQPVQFHQRNVELWLPQSIDFYIDIGGHRYLNRHRLSNYMLFAVDSSQQIEGFRAPK